jgi:hypothetical protein
MKGTSKIVRVGTKYEYSFNGTSLKSPIGTISWRRPDNFLHEIDFRGGHLNQDQHFKKMKWIKWSIIWFYDVKLSQGI